MTGIGDERAARLLDVLRDLMQGQDPHGWPGADGLTSDDILAGYLQAARRGQVPCAEELARRHPHLAAEIRADLGGNPCPQGG